MTLNEPDSSESNSGLRLTSDKNLSRCAPRNTRKVAIASSFVHATLATGSAPVTAQRSKLMKCLDLCLGGAARGHGGIKAIPAPWPPRACDADENLGEDTKRFIDRHVTPGEKRPPATSVRRDTGADQVARVGRKAGG
jgi:hypothetical protein